MLIKVLFALLALVALVLLFSPVRAGLDDAERLSFRLALAGMGLTSLGMVVPWGRWLPMVAPGRNLGFLSKLLGWVGAGALPAALVSGQIAAALACLFFVVAASALWKGKLWAAWAWYAVALAALVGSALSLLRMLGFFQADVGESSYAQGQRVGSVIGVVLWGAIGVVLWREITAWRRARSASSAPAEPQAP